MDGLIINATAMAAKFQSRVGVVNGQVERLGDRAIEAQMRSVRQVIVNTTPVDTGRLKASWGPVTKLGTLRYGCGNPRHYGPTLEYGGYPRVGPRTVRLGGGILGAGFVAGAGIYSQQAPLGFVRKALAGAVPQLRLRLRNVLKQAWGGLGVSDASTNEAPAANVSDRQTAISATGTNTDVLHQILASFQASRRRR